MKLKVRGVVVFAFPNTQARLRAVRVHDIHHVLTGYDTTWTGEAEIAVWELASGCGRYYAAWVLNLAAAVVGLVLCPGRMFAAARRGRASDNLYPAGFSDALLDATVDELRRRLRLSG